MYSHITESIVLVSDVQIILKNKILVGEGKNA
jgi:hypothetical protein